MSYENPRIKLEDSMMDVVMKMSDGNPGALTVLMQLLEKGNKIDPDAAFGGGFMAICDLDNLDIYADKIWMLYKDVCDEDITNMMGVLRAQQLGIVSPSDVVKSLGDHNNIDVSGLLAKVKERLPAFAA